MSDAVIGALRVTLALDSGDFSKGADKAYARASTLEKDLTSIAKRIAVAFGALEIGVAIQKQFEAIHAISQLSEQTGIGTAALSKFAYAADASGVSFEKLSTIIEHFSRSLASASRDSTNDFSQAINLLGVNLRDAAGRLRNFDEITLDAADKIKTYADGANKAAIVTAIWGKSSQEFINFLNKGSDGIREAGEEARKFGLVLDQGAAKSMKEAKEASDKLGGAWEGLVRTLTINLAPALVVVANAVSGLISMFGGLNKLSQKELGDEIDKTTAHLKALNVEQEQFNNSHTTNIASQVVQQSLLTAEIVKTKGRLEDLYAEWEKRVIHIEIKGELAPDLGIPEKLKAEFEEFQDKLQGLPALMGQSFAFDTRPFEQAMKRVEFLQDADIIKAQQANKIKLQLQRSEQQEILNTASLAASTLTALFGKSKLAAIASAIINTAVGVTKALSASPPPFNFINAALVAAAGAAQVATIKSASETGSGAVTAPAVPAAATDTGAGAGGPAQSQTLYVEGISVGGLFTGSAVRDLIERINQAVNDGAKLVLK